jgi:glutamyl-tRNA synthetase
MDAILSEMRWLGLDWDEGPYFQSERLNLYRDKAEGLLKAGIAYHHEGAVLFKFPKGALKIDDIVHGKLEFDLNLMEDLVIMKSDGYPTYNFACVVDDADLRITHVIRGDDHISNTPKQVVLYQALGLPLPEFAHIPLILGADRSRLSKRHGAVSVGAFRESGFLPEAVVNYLALLGWSPGDNRELMSREELINAFSLQKVNRTNAAFDEDKLEWMNSQYLKNSQPEELAGLVAPMLSRYSDGIDKEWLLKLLVLYQGRVKTLVEFVEAVKFFFVESFPYDKEAVEGYLRKDGTASHLEKLFDKLKSMASFDPGTLESELRGLAKNLGIKAGDLIHPTRVAVTGKSVSPGLFEVLALLGREKTLERLRLAIDELCAGR